MAHGPLRGPFHLPFAIYHLPFREAGTKPAYALEPDLSAPR
jgi:hypothetical protein